MSKRKKYVPKFDEFPERVTLCFRTKADRLEFMGGLSDGFGEQFCELDYEYVVPTSNRPSSALYSAKTFTVELIDPTDDQ